MHGVGRTRKVPAPRAESVHRSRSTADRRPRMTPRFLICGGQRCGTTSLYRALAPAPGGAQGGAAQGRALLRHGLPPGHGWYRGHFPLPRPRARRPRATASADDLRVEPVLHVPPAGGRRIAKDLPGVKLIVLVRDPVERAYSPHAHELARGYETERDFEQALALEAAGCAGRRNGWPPTRGTTASPPAPRVPPAASTRASSSGWPARRPGPDPRGGQRRFFAEPRPGVRRGAGVPRAAALGGPPSSKHNARPRPPIWTRPSAAS